MVAKGKAGVIGVGIMGTAMAKNLVAAGFDVIGYDVTPAALETLEKLGGRPARSNAEVLAEAEVIMVSLPTSMALVSVVDDLVNAPRVAGRVIAETSTLPLEDKAAARDRLAAVGITMMDCPLSGSGNRAMMRDVLVYASGERAAYDKCLPVFEAYSRAPFYVGAFGNGSKYKYINNHLVAVHTAAAAEAFAMARKAGLDPQVTYDVVIGGSGGSRAMEARKDMLISGRFLPVQTATMELFRKDLKVIGEFANSIDFPAPMFAACLPLYTAALANGMGEQDTVAVLGLLMKMAGIDINE